MILTKAEAAAVLAAAKAAAQADVAIGSLTCGDGIAIHYAPASNRVAVVRHAYRPTLVRPHPEIVERERYDSFEGLAAAYGVQP